MTELAIAPPPAARALTLRVTDLVLDYEIHEDRRAALRQRFVTRKGTGRSLVHALKGVSFDASEGDTIGIVGSNGSGKSTLLAAIAGMLPPTSGEILAVDEPRLLGVGATLLPAATGFRNIRLGFMALARLTMIVHRPGVSDDHQGRQPTCVRRCSGPDRDARR